MAGWRYLAYALNGDGTEYMVHPGLPLADPTLTRVLSGHHQIQGALKIPAPDLTTETGRPLFERWRTAIYAEDPNGKIWVGGLVADFDINDPEISLDVAGFTAYPADQHYDGEARAFVGEEALDVYRYMWEWLQSQPGGNLGLVVADTVSGVTVGTEAEDVDFQTSAGTNVSFTAGPYQINWWTTDDIGAKFDDLAKQTPFDWLEEHEWSGTSETPVHRLELGYPKIGTRQEDLRFMLGENVYKIPSEQHAGEDIVTSVIVLGAGEGVERVVGRAAITPQGSLRRSRTIDDKKITSNTEADARALAELEAYRDVLDSPEITELVIADHPNAPLGSYDVGDEVSYGGDHAWGPVDVWVKIVKLTIRPAQSNAVIATVVRA